MPLGTTAWCSDSCANETGKIGMPRCVAGSFTITICARNSAYGDAEIRER
jgi:hypothetical protein